MVFAVTVFPPAAAGALLLLLLLPPAAAVSAVVAALLPELARGGTARSKVARPGAPQTPSDRSHRPFAVREISR